MRWQFCEFRFIFSHHASCCQAWWLHAFNLSTVRQRQVDLMNSRLAYIKRPSLKRSVKYLTGTSDAFLLTPLGQWFMTTGPTNNQEDKLSQLTRLKIMKDSVNSLPLLYLTQIPCSLRATHLKATDLTLFFQVFPLQWQPE